VAETTSVYGGRASITFHEGKHYYSVKIPAAGISNLSQPSVTGIIGKLDKSNALLPWAVGEMANRVKELTPEGSTDKEVFLAIVDAAQDTWRGAKNKAADIGTLAHRALEQELLYRAGRGPKPKLPLIANEMIAPHLTEAMIEMANNAVRAGLRYFDEHKLDLVFTERVLWSPTFGYLGTTDGVAKIDGKLSVFDFKTSKRLYPTVWVQLAAYAKAYEEEFPEQKIEQRVGINIGRDGVLEVETKDNSSLTEDFKTFRALRQVWSWDISNQGKWSKEPPQIVGPLDKLLNATN
jgi:hypothetical protein